MSNSITTSFTQNELLPIFGGAISLVQTKSPIPNWRICHEDA